MILQFSNGSGGISYVGLATAFLVVGQACCYQSSKSLVDASRWILLSIQVAVLVYLLHWNGGALLEYGIGTVTGGSSCFLALMTDIYGVILSYVILRSSPPFSPCILNLPFISRALLLVFLSPPHRVVRQLPPPSNFAFQGHRKTAFFYSRFSCFFFRLPAVPPTSLAHPQTGNPPPSLAPFYSTGLLDCPSELIPLCLWGESFSFSHLQFLAVSALRPLKYFPPSFFNNNIPSRVRSREGRITLSGRN
ncbi:hypothetical protein HOY80DRAFT_725390 [Tuber brumale]|nr:hypothetical protein HOY80DRAFT_725390 [Tuber brumale]